MAAAGYAVSIALKGVPEFTSGVNVIDKGFQKLNAAGRKSLIGIIGKDAAKAEVGVLKNIGFIAVGVGGQIRKGLGEGVRQATQGFRAFGREVSDVTDKIGTLVPALGPLLAFGAGAGIAKAVTNFADAGGEIRRASSALGLNTQQLQANRIAWRLAGLSAEQFDQAFSGVNESLIGAQAGRNPQAIGAARQFGLHTGLPTLDFIKELANKIKQLNDLKVSVVTQGGLLEAFGISRDQLSLFQRGGDVIADFTAQGVKLTAFSEAAAERAQRLGVAFTGLRAAVEAAATSIIDNLTNRGLLPSIEAMTRWLQNTQNINDITNGITTAFKVVGDVWKFASDNLKGLNEEADRWSKLWGEGKLFSGIPGWSGYEPPKREEPKGSWLWSKLKGILGFINPIGSAEAATPPQAAETRDIAQRSVSLLQDIRDYLKALLPEPNIPHWGAGGPGGVGAAPPHYPHGSLGRLGIVDTPNARLAMDFFEKKGLPHYQAAGIVGTLQQESGAGLNPAIVNPTGNLGIYQADAERQRHFGGSTNIMDQLNAIWSEFQTTEAAAFANIKASRTAGETAVAMQGFERGGDYGGRNIAAAEKLNLIGSAPPVSLPAIPSTNGAMNDSGAGDSSHHVKVEFMNAPRGMRSGLVNQSGDASVSLRTRYAMDSVW